MSAVQPPTREQIAEHRWLYIFQERPNEISMRCSCGWLWKHLPMDHMRSVTLPRCPDEQPTAPDEPVSIADMAPGTCDECGGTGVCGGPPDRYYDCPRCSGEPVDLDDTRDDRDPSTIRDVTPPPATPEVDR